MRLPSLAAVSLLLAALPALSTPTSRSQPLGITALTASDISLAGGQMPTSLNPSASTRRLSAPTLATLHLLNHLQNLNLALLTAALANLSLPAYAADPAYAGPWPITTPAAAASTSPSVSSALARLAAQQKVQLATTQTLLVAHGAAIVAPCAYTFPAESLTSFLALASLLSTLLADFLVDAAAHTQHRAHADGSFIAPYLASLAATQARHDATLRLLSNAYPSPTPFATPLPAVYAYSLAARYITPNSCSSPLPLTALPRLEHPVFGTPDPAKPPPSEVTFSYAPSAHIEGAAGLWLGWIGQMGRVVYTPFTRNGTGGGGSPPPLVGEWNARGVVYVVLTDQGGEGDVGKLVKRTLAGPSEIGLS